MVDILPLAQHYGDRIAVLLDRNEFPNARRELEEAIVKMSYLHDPQLMGEAPISDLLMSPRPKDEKGRDRACWEWDLVDRLASRGIEYLSQIYGKTWEHLRVLGLDSDEIAWVVGRLDALESRIRRSNWQKASE